MVTRVKNMHPFDNYELVRAATRNIKSAILASADRSKNAEFVEEHNKVDGKEVGVLLVRYYGDWEVPDEYKHLHESQRTYYSLDDDTSTFIQKVIDEHTAQYPDLTIFWSVGEREWLGIHIEVATTPK